MALSISIKDPDTGIVLSYHRISALTQTTNQWADIQVCSYISKADRVTEQMDAKRLLANRIFEGQPIYSTVHYYQCPYVDGMTCSDAYDYLKTLPDFKKAEDVFEEGEDA